MISRAVSPLALLLLPLLFGCPPPRRVLVAQVSAPSAPVADALVAAECPDHTAGAAGRTDASGTATLEVLADPDPATCEVTVAKPGYRTLRRGGPRTCEKAEGCPPNRYDLEPEGGQP